MSADTCNHEWLYIAMPNYMEPLGGWPKGSEDWDWRRCEKCHRIEGHAKKAAHHDVYGPLRPVEDQKPPGAQWESR